MKILLRAVFVLCLFHQFYGQTCRRSPVVVAYLPEWRFESLSWDSVAEHVTHLLLFSVEVGSDGTISALDRLPAPDLMKIARKATQQHGTKLMICFGGNGRSAGFGPMVRKKETRTTFVASVVKFLRENDLDGVDYNWEYPGYEFGRGYGSQDAIERDYEGLAALVSETRLAFDKEREDQPDADRMIITLAYYPDKLQEKLLLKFNIPKFVDFMHIMAYDQRSSHSTFPFAQSVAKQSAELGLPSSKVTLGVPFYGRDVRSGEWYTYESLLQKHENFIVGGQKDVNLVENVYFNGKDMIKKKTRMALELGLAGVMIWEVGQDCRLKEVKWNDRTHVKTCKEEGHSLLIAISNVTNEWKRKLNDGGVCKTADST